MDIEGSEFEVLSGSGDFLDFFRARWLIEVHDPTRVSELTALFEMHGYLTEIVCQAESHPYPLLLGTPATSYDGGKLAPRTL